MTADVVAFVLARAAEREALALAARGQEPWTGRPAAAPGVWESNGGCSVSGDDIEIYDEGGHTVEQAAHIAHHDPARVLREVAAVREIAEHAAAWAETLRATPAGWKPDTAGAYRMAMEWTMLRLAAFDADHPDYQAEWATE